MLLNSRHLLDNFGGKTPLMQFSNQKWHKKWVCWYSYAGVATTQQEGNMQTSRPDLFIHSLFDCALPELRNVTVVPNLSTKGQTVEQVASRESVRDTDDNVCKSKIINTPTKLGALHHTSLVGSQRGWSRRQSVVFLGFFLRLQITDWGEYFILAAPVRAELCQLESCSARQQLVLHTRVHYLRAREQTCVFCCCRSASQTRHRGRDKEEDKGGAGPLRGDEMMHVVRCTSVWLVWTAAWLACIDAPPGGCGADTTGRFLKFRHYSQSRLVWFVEHFHGILLDLVFIIHFIHVFADRNHIANSG